MVIRLPYHAIINEKEEKLTLEKIQKRLMKGTSLKRHKLHSILSFIDEIAPL